MDDLDFGGIVIAELSIGRHPAIVLSTKEEMAASGTVFVVAISANITLSLPDDLIEVPHKLGMAKKCYVQCGIVETLPVGKVTVKNRKAWGAFRDSVSRQVRIAADRAKKLTLPEQRNFPCQLTRNPAPTLTAAPRSPAVEFAR